SGGAKLMAEMGATTADHLEQTDEQGIAALKKGNGAPVLLPGSAYALPGGATLMRELGAPPADNLEKPDEQGIAALKKANVHPVFLPGSVYALGSSRYPRAREMIETGLGIVLATDFNPGSSPTPSMLMVLSLACTQMKLSPAEAITASTLNAAYSLNRGDKIGSLEPGKLANFAIFDCQDYRELAYWFGMPQTNAVYIKGERIL